MKKNIDIIALGDSLTARGDWNKLLQKEHILNLGIDGDTTSGVLSRLHMVIELKPKQLFLMIGINDLSLSIPLEKIFENYKRIVEQLTKNSIKVILQLLFPTQMPAINKKIKLFNEMIKEYALEKSLKVLELNSSFVNEKQLLREDLTTDGLHLGQKAYKAWAYKLKQFL